ncbi:hypothetical protein TH53_25465 [Pedobacter lusitanus]|uniref:Uncharacterized protein n=1 Tax=Pedobacter lusitanus TaxID=1503925 RepID=A0A0D0FQ77_9SPHI|nr:hypothetical protein [Pedobacter lusitanus]KIO74609.1 hypothetical protein TH53_25465 [Pedobacter lusitanus]
MNRKHLINISVLLLFTIFISGCAIKQGFIQKKDGAFELTIKKSNQKHNPIIYGTAYEFGTKKTVPGALIVTDRQGKN